MRKIHQVVTLMVEKGKKNRTINATKVALTLLMEMVKLASKTKETGLITNKWMKTNPIWNGKEKLESPISRISSKSWLKQRKSKLYHKYRKSLRNKKKTNQCKLRFKN